MLKPLYKWNKGLEKWEKIRGTKRTYQTTFDGHTMSEAELIFAQKYGFNSSEHMRIGN